MSNKLSVALALKFDALLLEGLHWDNQRGVLWGVDIHGALLWCWDLKSPTCQSWSMPQRICWVIPEAGSSRLLMGLQGGFAVADRANPTQIQWLQQPFNGNSALRLNDAKADATGAIWAGSLNNDDESRSDGCLFRLDTSGQLSMVDKGYTVANGPAISADGKLMLHTDSGRRTIYVFDLDVAAGILGNKRVWKVFADDEGYPDGMCFDAAGCVWVAHWGAGCISCFAPDGSLLRRLNLPVTQVTNICFAGPGLDRMFVSSARVGLSADALARQPLAGGLFEVLAPGAVGLPSLACGPFVKQG